MKLFDNDKTKVVKQKCAGNCYCCGWRIPLHNNNTVGCLFGFADKYEIQENNGRIDCNLFVSDIKLEAHIAAVLKMIQKQSK